MTVTIHLHSDDALTIHRIPTRYGTFLSLRWPNLTVYLPDYDARCAQVARTIAADLIAAADTMESPATIPEVV